MVTCCITFILGEVETEMEEPASYLAVSPVAVLTKMCLGKTLKMIQNENNEDSYWLFALAQNYKGI